MKISHAIEGLSVVLLHISPVVLNTHYLYFYKSLPIKGCIVRHYEGHIHDSCEDDAVPRLPE